jgi:hypothetical protein
MGSVRSSIVEGTAADVELPIVVERVLNSNEEGERRRDDWRGREHEDDVICWGAATRVDVKSPQKTRGA